MNPTVEQTDILGDRIRQACVKRQEQFFNYVQLDVRDVLALCDRAAALQAQLDALKIMLERESRDMQKWNNRANQLAIEGQELRARLAEVEQERREGLSLDKVAEYAVEQFRRQAVAAVRRGPISYTTKEAQGHSMWELDQDERNACADFLQSLSTEGREGNG